MSDIPVIDPTMTPAWDKLDQLADNFFLCYIFFS